MAFQHNQPSQAPLVAATTTHCSAASARRFREAPWSRRLWRVVLCRRTGVAPPPISPSCTSPTGSSSCLFVLACCAEFHVTIVQGCFLWTRWLTYLFSLPRTPCRVPRALS